MKTELQNNEMIPFIEKIQDLSKVYTREVTEDDSVVIYADRDLQEISRSKIDYKPSRKDFNTLESGIKALNYEWVRLNPDNDIIFVSVDDYNRVFIYTEAKSDTYDRYDLYCMKMEEYKTVIGVKCSIEHMLINLQTQFIPTDDRDYLIKLLSNISKDTEVKNIDNGMAQKVEVKKGISMVGQEIVKPILELQPYRTFKEVEQPVSKFLVRVEDEKDQLNVQLLEADGGFWMMEAKSNIVEKINEYIGTCNDSIRDKIIVLS